MSEAHTCHHPNCNEPVPPARLACRKHWFELPQDLRNAVWRTYRKGQEVDKCPSREYITIVKECKRFWLRKQQQKWESAEAMFAEIERRLREALG